MIDQPPRFRTAQPKPCDACPAKTWGVIHDPASIEAERQIRADQRRLDLRELQATSRDLAWLIDQLVDDNSKPIEAKNAAETLDRVRSLTRRLITLTARSNAA